MTNFKANCHIDFLGIALRKSMMGWRFVHTSRNTVTNRNMHFLLISSSVSAFSVFLFLWFGWRGSQKLDEAHIYEFKENTECFRKRKNKIKEEWHSFTWLFIGSVFNWHMYPPRSSSVTDFMCKFQVFRSECDTVTRELCVMTCSWIAWIALVSAFTQPTC